MRITIKCDPEFEAAGRLGGWTQRLELQSCYWLKLREASAWLQSRDRPIYRSADIIGRYSRFLRVSVSADTRLIFADIFIYFLFLFIYLFIYFLLVLPHLFLIFVKYCSSNFSYLFYLTCFYYLLNIVFYIEVQ